MITEDKITPDIKFVNNETLNEFGSSEIWSDRYGAFGKTLSRR